MIIDIIEEFKHRKEHNESFSDILNLFITDHTILKEFFSSEGNSSENVENLHYY